MKFETVVHFGGGKFARVTVVTAEAPEVERIGREDRIKAVCFCGKSRLGNSCPDCGWVAADLRKRVRPRAPKDPDAWIEAALAASLEIIRE